jgi:hypothetical protein
MPASKERTVGADFRIDGTKTGNFLAPDDWGPALASKDDADWFAAHPGVNVRMRRPSPGEIAGVAVVTSDWLVVVTQIRPGMRIRSFRPSNGEGAE